MKNLLIAFIFLAVMAHISFAKEMKTEADNYSPIEDDRGNMVWSNQTNQTVLYNQINSTTQSEPKKPRSKWDFSDYPQDNKKSSDVLKKQKYSAEKQEYRQPKMWEPKKSLTTNNTTTNKLADQ